MVTHTSSNMTSRIVENPKSDLCPCTSMCLCRVTVSSTYVCDNIYVSNYLLVTAVLK